MVAFDLKKEAMKGLTKKHQKSEAFLDESEEGGNDDGRDSLSRGV